MDKRNSSSGLKQVCATVNRNVCVTESKALDKITRNHYWNELKLLLYTIEQPHGDGSSRHCYSRSLCTSSLFTEYGANCSYVCTLRYALPSAMILKLLSTVRADN